jgi:uncharacterized coiled-coil protein SlyX
VSTHTEQPFSPLVADILTAMTSQTAAITNQVIDGLTEQLADSRAEVDAIRERIHELLSGPYLPNPEAIERALYPSPEARARYRRDGDQ